MELPLHIRRVVDDLEGVTHHRDQHVQQHDDRRHVVRDEQRLAHRLRQGVVRSHLQCFSSSRKSWEDKNLDLVFQTGNFSDAVALQDVRSSNAALPRGTLDFEGREKGED